MNKTKQSDYYIKEVEKGKYKIYISSIGIQNETRRPKSLYNSHFTSEEKAVKHIRKLENQDKYPKLENNFALNNLRLFQ